jgi:peptidylprolyl isomerase
MKLWNLAVIGAFASLPIHGCSEPGPIMTVTPPGAAMPRISPDADPAQALGEAAASSPAKPADAKTADTKTADTPKAADAKPAEAVKTAASTPPAADGKTKTSPLGVKYEILKEGSGPEAKSGDQVIVHYVGTLENGQQFDSSRPKNQPFPVRLGQGRVIQGWDDGIPGMKVGELRKLIIPSKLGYGAGGSPPVIPPNATLIFEVELLKINP